MFSVVFVDDDPAILQGFPFLLDWPEYGFEIVKTFSNPAKAIAYCKENPPDMIISDIRMPEINGLDLVSTLVPALPNTIFVMLTAYGEFEYAKTAMKYGVTYYLLKPVDEEELIHVLVECKEKLLAKKPSSQSASVPNRTAPNPDMQALLYALITDHRVEQPLPDEQDTYYCICLQEHTASFQSIHTGCENACWLPLSEFDAIVLMDADKKNLEKNYKTVFLQPDGTTQYAVISPIMKGLQMIPSTYHKTVNIFHACRFFVSCSNVIYAPTAWYSIGITSGFFFSQISANISRIETGLLSFDYDIVRQELLNLECKILNLPSPPDIPVLRDSFLQMLKRLRTNLRLHCHLGSAEEQAFDAAEQHILQVRSYEAIRTEICELYEQIWSSADCNALSTSNRIVGYAKFYIRQNYRRDFRVADIASACHVHPNYLSSLFTKEVGINIWTFVQQQRLEHACHLLQNTDLRISQISEESGFKNLNTFYAAFKKQYGQSPNSIRSKLKQVE